MLPAKLLRNRYLISGFFLTIFAVFTAILSILYYFGPASEAGFKRREPITGGQHIPLLGPSLESLIPGQDFVPNVINIMLAKNSGLNSTQGISGYIDGKLRTAGLTNARVDSIEPLFDVGTKNPNYSLKKSLGMDRAYIINFSSDVDTRQITRALSDDNKITSAELSLIGKPTTVPNDTIYNDQVNYPNQWQHDVNHYNSEAAWDISTGTPSTVIAFIETAGFNNWTHPDLIDNIWQNLGEDADQDGHVIEQVEGAWQYDPGDINNVDDDADGKIDDFIGWNFINNNNTVTGGDHGTVVVGSALATTNNNLGVASLCWNCRAMLLRNPNEYQAIQYAVDRGADVISVSQEHSFSLFNSLAVSYAEAANVPVVAGSLNENADVRSYPAQFPQVIAVTGSNQNDTRIIGTPPSASSPYGAWADVASSFNIWTTIGADGYQYSGGTSVSAPMVAGLIGLMKSIKPDLTNDQVRSIIRTAVDPVSGNEYFGTGRIDAYQALNYVKNAVDNNLAIPIAKLDPWFDNKSMNPKTIITITGTATSTDPDTDFDYFNLEYGIGAYPSSWNLFYSSSTPVKDGFLGTLYGNSLPSGTSLISLRLTVGSIDPGTQQTLTTVDKTVIPINERSIFRTDSPVYGALTTADLDNDDDQEIIAGTTSGKMYVFNHNGALHNSSWPKNVGNSITATPAIGDLDEDGDLEIVAGAANSNLYVWDQSGNILSGWENKSVSGQIAGLSPILADINNDHHLEVVVTTNDGHIYVWNRTGTLLWSYSLNTTPMGAPAVGDTDGDGRLEIVIGVPVAGSPVTGAIKILNDNGSLAATISLPAYIGSSVALADFNNDDLEEIVVGTNNYDNKLYVLKQDGSNFNSNWPKSLGSNNSVVDAPAIGDIDGDGNLDITINSNDNKIWAWSGDGTSLSGSWPAIISGMAKSMPIIADIDDDGDAEILVNAINSALEITSKVVAIESNGSIKTGDWPKYTEYQISDYPPLVTDLDDDGKLEIITGDGSVAGSGGGDSVYVWWTGVDIGTGDWPQRYHDMRNTHQTGTHCGITNDRQCQGLPNQIFLYCRNGSSVPKCSVCGCPSGGTCLGSGYCSGSGGGDCRPSCEFE
ncbi:MAG: hypothetical protein C3F02_02005 [Parcubacteria group bacterium]|nr:MAG: hypothetical protein C3F02_02005 [Parcubacteria group bacterium]